MSPPVAFQIYDLGDTGNIDRSEIRTMLLDTLKEDAALAQLPDAALERIIDNTFSVASKEGKLLSEHSIGPGEWLSFCTRSPSILNNMTLPVLRELTTVRRGATRRSRTKEIPNKRRIRPFDRLFVRRPSRASC